MQRIAVLLADLVPGEFALAEPFVVIGIIENDVARQLAQFARRDPHLRIGQTIDVGEVRLGQSDLAGAVVHHPHELGFVAGDAFGERNAAVIGRLDHDALQQVLDLHPAVQRRVHGRAVRRRTALAPGVDADDVFVVEADVAKLELVEHHIDGHQLGEARRRHQSVGLLLEQDGSGFGFDQERVRRQDLRRRGERRARPGRETSPPPMPER